MKSLTEAVAPTVSGQQNPGQWLLTANADPFSYVSSTTPLSYLSWLMSKLWQSFDDTRRLSNMHQSYIHMLLLCHFQAEVSWSASNIVRRLDLQLMNTHCEIQDMVSDDDLCKWVNLPLMGTITSIKIRTFPSLEGLLSFIVNLVTSLQLLYLLHHTKT